MNPVDGPAGAGDYNDLMEIPGYRIIRPIGKGGMATAYLAIQESLERQVVLKVLSPGPADTAESVERFLNEGRIVASLRHPNIITIYDIGIADEVIYISMEYVEGGDLKQRMAEFSVPEKALELLLKIGSALDAVHQRGIIHRDVKPGNILFRDEETPLLTDFGIAKQTAIDHDLTSTGLFVGSPNYMAPEQAEGGAVDGRADLYSLGVIFHEMLTGRKPYEGRTVVEILMLHRQAPIPKLPPDLEVYQELLELLLAKRPRDRFRDARSMIDYIERMQRSGLFGSREALVRAPEIDITGEHPVVAPPAAEPPAAAVEGGRRHTLLGVLLFLAVTFFAGVKYLEHRLLENGPEVVQVPEQIPDLRPPPPAPAARQPLKLDEEKVLRALSWLGRHSLAEYRLVTPPKDNAYYYFSRMLEIDPASEEARRGLKQIAERYALLAEEAVARNDGLKALGFIEMGLKIDPENRT
ncbi:MAG: serine/threonine protein kinase, partial [Gammaproteobacteria bacterium]